MRIEWLNAEKTRAIVTKGWIWKRWAEVYLGIELKWLYAATDERVGLYLASDLWEAKRPTPKPEPWPEPRLNAWQRVGSLPQARTLK